jgi:transcriptional regulator with XRE-family HTH domain
MATATSSVGVGPLLREWRERRRLTQLELALDAGVSARHVSFVETGRSHPGRDMLLRVAGRLDIPYRDRNRLLIAAGHAPAFPERSLEDPTLAPVRSALDRILAAHEPYPATVIDRGWNLVAANTGAGALFEGIEVDSALLEPPINLLRLGLHPGGFAPRIVNLADWRAHFLRRLAQQVAVTGDSELEELMEEIAGYPGGRAVDRDGGSVEATDVLGPVRVYAPDGGEWAFFGMFASFDTPFEVTASELALELLFPADRVTEEAFKKGAP